MHIKNEATKGRNFDDNNINDDLSPQLSTTLSDITITTLNGKSGNNYYNNNIYINFSLSSSYYRIILALKNYSLE